jgi:isoleucyl-tRNA synthetase
MAKTKPYFDAPDLKPDFPSMEKKMLEEWKSAGIVQKYLNKNDKSQNHFSFLDGPITANNPMGVHHAWGRTYKDLWQRYKNLKGFKQRFQNGFDCQGLWVEVEVEKELGFKNKKDIEEYGVEKFVEKCKERVVKYSAVQTEQSKRLGYFMDWENSYYTMSDENNYMIWHFLKTCHENGWLYKGADSVPWCPRCETAISQHEILTEDYQEVKHDSIILEFPIQGTEEFLLVWTTTPWTIPANISVAVDEKLNYSLVEGSTGDKFWLASDAVIRVFGESNQKIIKTVKGSALVGLTYSGAFDDLPAVAKVKKENSETFHKVIPTDDRIMPISTEEGTGLVHTAVSAGTEDFRLGQKLGLPMIPVIADDASYLSGLGEFTGKNAKDHPEIILDHLRGLEDKGENWVFDIFPYSHRYPACWRCKSELVWKVTDEWYIAMDKPSRSHSENQKSTLTLRERMINVAKSIKWLPSFGLKRELDWLANMSDWLISKKNRYWGLALPIWECKKCGNFEVIGSFDELKERAVLGWEEFECKTPHKPQIDKIKIKCIKCDREVERVEPVGNPWLDAGIVSFSTISKDNKSNPLYKTDKENFDKWFPADFITESFPGQFKNWFYSLIAMSTVLEDKRPTDTILGYATLFAEDGKPMHKSAGNMIGFDEGADKIGVDVMRWMFVTQNPSENLLFGYKLADETRRRFLLKLWNVYNFFVTYANLDGWKPENADLKSTNVLDKWILTRFAQTLELVEKALDHFHPHTAAVLLEQFVDDLSNWYIRRSRERVGPGSESRQESAFFYQTSHYVLVNLCLVLAPFIPFVTDLIYKNLTKKDSIHLADWPVVNVSQDNDLLTQTEAIRQAAEKIHAQRKQDSLPVRRPLLKVEIKSTYPEPDPQVLRLLKDEVNVMDVQWTKGGTVEVKLDDTITPELEMETKTRELIRNIQEERKKMGLNLHQETHVYTPWMPEDEKMLERIKNKTLTSKITHSDKLRVELAKNAANP